MAAPPDRFTGLAEDHMRATRGDGLVSSDSTSVSRWLAARLPFAMEVPELPGLRIRGARLCLMDGRRGGVVEYSSEGRPVSYFVVPDGEPAERPPIGELRSAVRAGYHVVTWREPGLVHALVGDLPEATLLGLARLCIQKAMALLTPQM
jgi:anti-sigma factor RsiW